MHLRRSWYPREALPEKAQRCRCDGRWQARVTAPNGSTVKAPSPFKAKIDAEAWVKAERALTEDPTSYVTA